MPYMKLREFNFNSIKPQKPFRPVTLSVRIKGDGNEWKKGMTIGDTLRMLPEAWADYTIAETRWFMDEFCIELYEPGTEPPEPAGPPSEYTVCYLFSHDFRKVLLVRKGRTSYMGRLNGVGGLLEDDEDPADCAIREIREETGLDLDPARLRWLGRTELPSDCADGKHAVGCVLHFYYAALGEDAAENAKSRTDTGEALVWADADAARHAMPTDQTYAGDGDIGYWINTALIREGVDAPRGNGRRVDIIIGGAGGERLESRRLPEWQAPVTARHLLEGFGEGHYAKIVPTRFEAQPIVLDPERGTSP